MPKYVTIRTGSRTRSLTEREMDILCGQLELSIRLVNAAENMRDEDAGEQPDLEPAEPGSADRLLDALKEIPQWRRDWLRMSVLSMVGNIYAFLGDEARIHSHDEDATA